MKLPLLLLALISFPGVVPARDRVPIEDFARTPDTAQARLSPDGKLLAFIREADGRPTLHTAEIDAQHITRLRLGEAEAIDGVEKTIGGFQWVGNQRLFVTTTVWDLFYGAIATNSDGSMTVGISGYELEPNSLRGPWLFAHEVLYRFLDVDQRILMLDRHESNPGSYNRPDIILVDTSNGNVSVLLKNPGEVRAWGVDGQGRVRFGILSHGEQSGAIYRDTEDAPWRTILPLAKRANSYRPIGFDAANNGFFVAALTDQKRRTVFPLNVSTGAVGQALLSDPEYDILPEHFTPAIDGHALAAPILAPKTGALLGIRYVTDAPRVKWFDRELMRMQAAVDRAAPNTVNLLIDISLNGKRQLWFGYSDQNPGVYYLADLEKHSFKPLVPHMSWIKPAQMAQTLNVKYTARDGLVIHGFLTVPVGLEPKNLPLVVMPHGGPWVRDVWGFDPLIQLLANRGYAVLQMNYRGSPGYGEELYTNAKRQIGHQIQDDIEDATRWAIKTGVADPTRVAIFGESYGGYSALFATGQNPELYRCAISFAGVTDWPAMFNKSDAAEYKDAKRYWREQIGDPKDDAAMLAAISPINFADKITAPVLLIQGKDDRRVPPDQAKRMSAALEKTGHKPELLLISGLGHTLGREKQRLVIFKAVVDFLEKNLGPGAD